MQSTTTQAKHIDLILGIPEIHAIQWAQGMADDYPIMQHLDFIRYVQSKGRGVIVDLDKRDLNEYMERMSPEHTLRISSAWSRKKLF